MAHVYPNNIIELQNVELWLEEQSGKYYLKLEYSYENKCEIGKIIYPKIDIGISKGFCNINISTAFKDLPRIHFTYSDEYGYPILPDKDGKTSYVEVITKKKVHELTVDEVEKELGYSVKIVSKKEKK